MEEKKTLWSLQDDKRSASERAAFQPTGKTHRKPTLLYVVGALGVLLLVSFSLTFLGGSSNDVCITEHFCFNPNEAPFWYTLYIFSTILIVISALLGAYFIGKKIGDRFQL